MPSRLLLTVALAAAALTVAPAAASAVPPVNDNYLASTALNQPGSPLGVGLSGTVDTTEATTQQDLFNPDATGQPLGGDGVETTRCGATNYGKTVWYDFHPNADGDVEISTAGFDAVIAVYQWNLVDSKITKAVKCQDTPGLAERMDLVGLQGGKHYTIQIGGVAGPAGVAGGPLSFSFDFFPDTDKDGLSDPLDKCPTEAGIDAAGGCPPELNVSTSIGYDKLPTGVRIVRLVVARVPKGAKLVARCAGCPTETIKAKRTGTVKFTKLVGRSVRAGAAIEVKVTLGPTGSGKYRFGATGKRIRFPVRAGTLATRSERCLNVKSGKVQRCS